MRLHADEQSDGEATKSYLETGFSAEKISRTNLQLSEFFNGWFNGRFPDVSTLIFAIKYSLEKMSLTRSIRLKFFCTSPNSTRHRVSPAAKVLVLSLYIAAPRSAQARFRLYRYQFLQVNSYFSAFFEIHKIIWLKS